MNSSLSHMKEELQLRTLHGPGLCESRDLSRDELWYKIIQNYISLALLSGIMHNEFVWEQSGVHNFSVLTIERDLQLHTTGENGPLP